MAEILQHFPGPWRVVEDGESVAVLDANDWVLLSFFFAEEFGREHAVALARVIAEAPELLSAARIVLDWAGNPEEWTPADAALKVGLQVAGPAVARIDAPLPPSPETEACDAA